jgi:steroid delta-isomerase-like uncharacterized protein
MAQSAVDVARMSVDCFNDGNFDRLRSLLADDSYEEEHATQRRLDGAEAQIEVARAWKEAFPDGHGTVERAYAAGDTVTLEITWAGTHTGRMLTPDGQELPPSNRHATVSACEVIEIEDGRIKATRHYFDLMTILAQIGVTERTGTTA